MDAGRRSHASVRVLLFGAFFMNNHHTLEGQKKKKKTFKTLEPYTFTCMCLGAYRHTSVHAHGGHLPGCHAAPAPLLIFAACATKSSWLPWALTPPCSWSTQSEAGKAQSVSPNTAQAVRLTAFFPLIQAAPLTHTLSPQHLRWIGMICLQSLMIMYSTLAVKLFRPALLLSP